MLNAIKQNYTKFIWNTKCVPKVAIRCRLVFFVVTARMNGTLTLNEIRLFVSLSGSVLRTLANKCTEEEIEKEEDEGTDMLEVRESENRVDTNTSLLCPM